MLFGILNGDNFSSPVGCCEVLLAMSSSDANTENLIKYNVLDALELAFVQGPAEFEGRPVFAKYNIPQCRQACASVMLNLTLSAKSLPAVVAHVRVAASVKHAMGDAENLTTKAKKRLKDVMFQLKISEGDGETPRANRDTRGCEKKEHLMLSYCCKHITCSHHNLFAS